jgi:hypothetical protein
MEYDDVADAKKLVIRCNDRDKVAFKFWDYKGKRCEMTALTNVAIVLARSIKLCIDGSLDQVGIRLQG